jgi:hypothetical protein
MRREISHVIFSPHPFRLIFNPLVQDYFVMAEIKSSRLPDQQPKKAPPSLARYGLCTDWKRYVYL